MPEALHESFHEAFERALGGDATALRPWWRAEDSALDGLRVYRNTTAKGLADALIAQYPAVTAIVGEAWMVAVAREFCVAHPPATPPLAVYGKGFADWLAPRAREADLPFLPDLARLDRQWTESHTAADDPVLSPDDLGGLRPDDFLTHRIVPHASSRWSLLPWTVPTLWRALRRDPALPDFELEDRVEGLLICRPDLVVESLILSQGGAAFLDHCGQGASMATAAGAAMTAEPGIDLQSTFAGLVAAGAFTRLEEISP